MEIGRYLFNNGAKNISKGYLFLLQPVYLQMGYFFSLQKISLELIPSDRRMIRYDSGESRIRIVHFNFQTRIINRISLFWLT